MQYIPSLAGLVAWIVIPIASLVYVGLILRGAPALDTLYSVPGGLAIRNGFSQARDHAVSLYTRKSSFLVVHHMWSWRWGFIVGTTEEKRQGVLTRSEAELLLRAWLSPAHPPTKEQLEALL